MLHVNGPSSSTAALINAFIDSDDEPLYDKVASDEDYSSLPHNEQQQQKRNKINKKTKKIKENPIDGLLQSPSEVKNLFYLFDFNFDLICL
jgi:hypothetical protein